MSPEEMSDWEESLLQDARQLRNSPMPFRDG